MTTHKTSPATALNNLLRHTVSAAVVLVGTALVQSPGHALDLNNAIFNPDTAYSATQTTTVDKDTIVMEVFKEGEKMRMDINEQGQSVSVIMRMDQKTNYMLMHEMSMFQEVKSKRIKQYQKDMNLQFTNQQQTGTETVNGFSCTRYTADFTDDEGTKGTGTYWINSDDIMIRAVMTSKRRRRTTETTIDLSNLKVGDQPDELFEVPGSYQSLGFGSLMGNAMRPSRNDRPVSDQEREPEMQDEQAPESENGNDGQGKNIRKALKGLFGKGNG